MSAQRARILPPYTRRVNDTQHKATKLLLVASLILFSMIMGFTIAVFGLRGWFLPSVPIILLAGLALWMAPDVDTKLDGAIERSYFIFWGFALIWPNYIALNIPGLPWISFERLSMMITAIISLTAISMSSRMRGELADVLTSNKVLLRFFLCWVLIHALMLMVGQLEAAGRWVHHSLVWHLLFILSAWVMVKPGRALRLNSLILLAIGLTAAVVIPEFRNAKPIWVDYIPGFLGIDPELQELLQFGVVRGENYRARSIFVVSLVYAEYIGMLLPFVLLAIVSARSGWSRAGSLALLSLVATAAYLTQARSAMIALLVGTSVFAAIWVFRRFRENYVRRDVISAGMLYGSPIVGLSAVIVALTVPRFRVRILGGGQHAASDNARELQWEMAIPQILKNPIGYGMGSSERVVPYTNLAGKWTIDSYPINLLIEYGVPGFVAFVGFFATAIYLGTKTYMRAQGNPEEELSGAAAVGILSFLITRLILSSEAGQTIAFGFAGVILGLYYRQTVRLTAPSEAPFQPRSSLSYIPSPLPHR